MEGGLHHDLQDDETGDRAEAGFGPFARRSAPREMERRGGADSPDYQFENKEMLEAVRTAVDSLIDSRRQVVSLFLDGMSADEITAYFGWSDGKARNLLSRGLADVRQALKKRGIEFEE
jgi:DNA-directed RNA polymerase specialized sigma24 family protein